MTPLVDPRISADEAIRRLKVGNEHFVSGVLFYPPIGPAKRAEVVEQGQQPFAVILGCSDSRVPPEVLFNLGLGDAYVVRIAGNVCATDEMAAVEYSISRFGIPLCVVLGHSQCGAVTAALTGEELPESVERLIAPILPAVAQVKRDHPDLPAAQLAGLAVEANVWQAMKDLLAQSEIVRVAVSLGRLQLTGAVYDLVSGCVEWLGQHPRQNALLQD